MHSNLLFFHVFMLRLIILVNLKVSSSNPITGYIIGKMFIVERVGAATGQVLHKYIRVSACLRLPISTYKYSDPIYTSLQLL